MKPNLFIIGAPKCGTSALAHYLSEHPKVFFTNPKEPFYLCTDYPHLKEQHFLKDDDDYLNLFSGADRDVHTVIGEGSTNYLRSEAAVKNALAINPDAKFIVMLRNPINVSHAFHMEQIFARNEDVASFEEAWHLQEERKHGKKIPKSCRAPEFLQYGEIALFSEQLERFFNSVPEKQRLLLLQDDLQKDTLGTYKKTLDFLDLDYDGRVDFPRVNSSHTHRSELIANLILSPPRFLKKPMFLLRGMLRRSKPAPVEWIKAKLRKKSSREEISISFKRDLLAYFLADIELTEALIQRDLSGWKEI